MPQETDKYLFCNECEVNPCECSAPSMKNISKWRRIKYWIMSRIVIPIINKYK